ncbi:hypothetical protein EBR66_03785 [bacterium]|nr:hypothetical protein [bacterium]
MNWLKVERSPLWLLGFAFAVAIVSLAVEIPISELLEPYLKTPETEKYSEEVRKLFLGDEYRTEYKKAMFHLSVFGVVFLFALWEEVVFRMMPLGMPISAQRRSWIATLLIVAGLLIAGAILYDNFGVLFRGRDPIILIILSTLLAVSMFLMIFLKTPWLLWVMIVCSSALFGYTHHGCISLFMQGLGGITLSIVYLKCGGVNGK